MSTHSSQAKEKGSDDIYRIMVETAPDMIAIVRDGQLCYVNPAASHMLGYAPDELRQMGFLDLVAPHHRQAASQMCALRWSHRPAPRYALSLVRKDGQSLPLDICPSPITYEGQPAVQLVARDISQQQVVTEHQVQSEKMAALSRFISAVAHELNNPLTVIAGFAEILLSNLLNEQDRADLQMVVDEAKRARRMLHDVLSLSRERPLQRRSIDLNQLIVATLDRYQAEFQESRVRAVTQLAPDLPRVSVDPDQLGQALGRIISYFRKSLTSAGEGGTLRVETAVQHVSLQTHVSRVVEITFTDDGPRRTQDQLRQIFEPRFTTKEEDQGLGLALSYNVILRHGGRSYAHSHPGGGLRLVIELPCPES